MTPRQPDDGAPTRKVSGANKKRTKTTRKKAARAKRTAPPTGESTVLVKRPRGRPPKIPTPDQLGTVERLAALGLTYEEMAFVIDIDIKTFRAHRDAHYLPAIQKGKVRGKITSGASLMREVGKGNLGAIVWYEKTRHGMTEKVHTVVSSPEGGPVESNVHHSGAVAIGLFLPPNGRDVPAPGQVFPPGIALPSNSREVSGTQSTSA